MFASIPWMYPDLHFSSDLQAGWEIWKVELLTDKMFEAFNGAQSFINLTPNPRVYPMLWPVGLCLSTFFWRLGWLHIRSSTPCTL
jgi:hypothetical protein